jgi:hypothetical protein
MELVIKSNDNVVLSFHAIEDHSLLVDSGNELMITWSSSNMVMVDLWLSSWLLLNISESI